MTVVLLESGGLDYEAATAALNAGENVGEDYYDLEDSRLRFFGGTTAIWGGRCAELDPIDLERRDYVPHSGWPIGWEELERWYRGGAARLRTAGGAAGAGRSALGGSEAAPLRRARDPALDLRSPLQPLRLGKLRRSRRRSQMPDRHPCDGDGDLARGPGDRPGRGAVARLRPADGSGQGVRAGRRRDRDSAAPARLRPRQRPGRPLFHGASARPRRPDRQGRGLALAQGVRAAAPDRRAGSRRADRPVRGAAAARGHPQHLADHRRAPAAKAGGSSSA